MGQGLYTVHCTVMCSSWGGVGQGYVVVKEGRQGWGVGCAPHAKYTV